MNPVYLFQWVRFLEKLGFWSGDTTQDAIDTAVASVSSPSAAWGDLGGTLSDQADLQTELDRKLDSSAAVTDHGALTGLADDGHTQYYNDTRGDARYYTKSQTYTQSEVDTIVGALATSTFRVTFYCNNATSLTLTNSPAAARFIGNSSGHVQLADLSTYSQVRLQCRVATAGTASSKLKLMYATASPTSFGSYADIGSAGAVAASMAATTVATSGWLDLAAGAIADNLYLCIAELDGDGVADPALRTIIAEFR